MIPAQRYSAKQINTSSLIKRMAIGAGIALVLILLFLVPIRDPEPEWGTLWMVKPVLVVTLAGAVGGAVYFFMHHLLPLRGWRKTLLNAGCLLIYLIGLWLGTVLGLNGTLWN